MARRSTPSSSRARTISRVRRALACAAVVAAAVAASVGGTQAASSNVTVTLDVLSSTTMDAAGCPVSAQRFGTVLPDSSLVAAAPCAISFGSSNNSSMLKLYQQDRFGDAMFTTTQGGMDTSFGPGGVRTIDFPEGNANPKWGALQPDGQYVLLGSVTAGGDDDVGVARIGATGTMDAGFGDGGTGRKVHDFKPGDGETVRNGRLQSDGKIVGVGAVSIGGFDNGTIFRFTAAGQFDPTFGGGDGYVEIDSAGWDQFWDVEIISGGKILAVGCSCQIGPSAPLLARLNSDGSLDTGFGTNGVLEPAGWGSSYAEIQSIVPLADGKLIVGGVRDNGAGRRGFVARITAAGAVDTTYGVSGFRDIAWPGGTVSGVGRISLANIDGSVWVPGHVDIGGPDESVGMARVNANGNLDVTWNSTGLAVANYGTSRDFAYGAVPLASDRVLAVGGTNGDYHATTFTNGGTAGLDTTFSSDGKMTIDIAGAFDYAVAPFSGREGKVVIPGTATSGGVARFGIAVLAGGGTIPDYGGGAVFGSANTQSAFGACLEARSGAGVAGGWTVDPGGSCTAVVGDPWNGIADTAASPTAKVLGSPTAGVINATATIRFGVKTALAQSPRDYSAPLVLEVIAPDA